MLKLWGELRHDEIRSFAEVCPVGARADQRLRSTVIGSFDWAKKAISILRFTGSEEELGALRRRRSSRSSGRDGAVAAGRGKGERTSSVRRSGRAAPSLMFNGPMETSYSGARAVALGTCRSSPTRSSMTAGSMGWDLEHEGRARLLRRSATSAADGAYVAGDALVAAVSARSRRTQYGDAQGAE